MDARTGWFVAGLVLVALLSIYQPKVAGALVLLIVVVLAVRLAQQGKI